MIQHHVTITYRDNKKETFIGDEAAYIGGDWVTLYDGHKRTNIPAQCIARITSDIKIGRLKK